MTPMLCKLGLHAWRTRWIRGAGLLIPLRRCQRCGARPK